ncbi:MAG: exodeoxyribonuclease VII large subunit [Methanocalculaceae archaeon]|nr:exodeoxyribonuclease VII large subunit [Methanocalculaceae archaeon]
MQLRFCDAESDNSAANVIEPVLENFMLGQEEPLESREPAVLSVSELAKRIRKVIDTPLLTGICVQGEITGYRPQSSGHMYFSLSEYGGDKATMPCVMWKSAARIGVFPVKDGVLVRATGYVDFYAPYGKIQFVIKKLEHALSGKAGLCLQKEQWKIQLTKEGVIPRPTRNRRSLPIFPHCVGIVTSRTGSVLQDIRNVIARHYPLPILLAHTAVQGDGAHIQIAAAIALLQGKADVIILARGGGSFEDLFEFNHPDVVRAVAASAVPIISAVGHETDTTLADYAADCRAPTPSAAAETAVPNRSVLLQQLEEMRRQIRDTLSGCFAAERNILADLRGWIDTARLVRKLDQMHQQTVDLTKRLTAAISRRIAAERNAYIVLGGVITKSTKTQIATARLELLAQKEIIFGRSPYKPLERGYALIWKDGAVVRSAKNIRTNDRLCLRLADGEAATVVESITYDRNT